MGTSNVAGISDFAAGLLAWLRLKRRTEEERRRSVLFICHSLGGIIVKKVCICLTPSVVFFLLAQSYFICWIMLLRFSSLAVDYSNGRPSLLPTINVTKAFFKQSKASPF